MKIKIGNYPNRLISRFHTRYMEEKYGVDWPETQTSFERSLEWIEDRVQNFYNVFNWIWFDRRTQGIVVQIDKWDTWNMDVTLAHIVVPMLKQLKATKHGYPADLTEEEWDQIMDKMIFSFNSKLHDWEDQFQSGEHDVVWTKNADNNTYTMERGPNDTFEIDMEGMREYQSRIDEGFQLFGKYYENLWD